MTRRIAPSRRGFTLPLVIAVAVIAVTILGAILTRHTGSAFSVQSQINSYADHHTSKGVQESLAAWLNANASGPISGALDADGKAFDLVLENGQVITVWLTEVQGRALAGFEGLSAGELTSAATILDELRNMMGEQRSRDLIRKEGPLPISVLSAELGVIEAAARSVVGATRADDVAAEMLRFRREEQEPDNLKLNEALTNVQLAPEDRAKLLTILTADPTLWQVDVLAQTPGRDPTSYRALIMIQSAKTRSRQTSGGVQRGSSFLSWQRVYDDSDSDPNSPRALRARDERRRNRGEE